MSKDKIKLVGDLLKRKTVKSLRLSFIIFNCMLVLFNVVIMLLMSQYFQLETDFFSNDNTHLIEVTSKQEMNQSVFLGEGDEEVISQALHHSLPDVDYVSSPEYRIGFGVSDEQDRSYFIYMLNAHLSERLGLNFADDKSGFLTAVRSEEEVVLKLPKVESEDGGYISTERTDCPIKIRGMEHGSRYLINGPEKLYVSEALYSEIMKEMFPRGQENDIRRILVYVDDLKHVDQVAEIISSLGFNIYYTLDSFDDLSSSLTSILVSSAIIVFVLLVITIINLLISSEIYLKNSQKDIGIFRHYGYQQNDVYRIYKSNFNRLFLLLFTEVEGLSGIGLFFMVSNHRLEIFTMLTLMMFLTIGLISFIITRRIKHYTYKSVLELLKFSKESE